MRIHEEENIRRVVSLLSESWSPPPNRGVINDLRDARGER